MQDRYAGDIGDFGKFGMLRQVGNTGLKIGINWYLTYKPEENNSDGEKTDYLMKKSFRGCDEDLFDKLYEIVYSNRSVAALEKANIVPNAEYYSEILKPRNDKSFSREEWYKNSMKTLADSDIIFCDPDNGLIVKSETAATSDKYVTDDELVNYYLSGKSVIFYSHRGREDDLKYLTRLEPLRKRRELISSNRKILKFNRGGIRFFIFILQPDHLERINSAIEDMMQSDWNYHFTEVEI